ncbi:hypothetical protein [Microbacterium gubbeenense]|uniref:hypothetical protein n=1 Tax=Microbacterium gubbeenense TaxID=159896 RepID=UPI003F94E0FD
MSSPYRDSSGHSLVDYPRPSVAVDTAVLTFGYEGALAALIVDDEGSLRLPGTFVHERETLAQASMRALRSKADVEGLAPANCTCSTTRIATTEGG